MSRGNRELRDTFKQEGAILPAVRRHVLKTAPDGSERDQTVLHPSEMAKRDWCHRKDFYRITGGSKDKTSGPRNSFRTENTFRTGHDIHRKWQGWLADMGVLIGNWECKSCSDMFAWCERPVMCPNCMGESFYYTEVPLFDHTRTIGGKADGIILVEDEHLLVEVKSIGLGTIRVLAPQWYQQHIDGKKTLDELWMGISHPFGDHIRQASIYTYMARSMYPINRMVFIYEFKANQDAKEFVVNYTEPTQVLELASDVTEALRRGTPPARREMFEETGPQGRVCSECEYRTICWGLGDSEVVPAPPERLVRVQRVASKRRTEALRGPKRVLT